MTEDYNAISPSKDGLSFVATCSPQDCTVNNKSIYLGTKEENLEKFFTKVSNHIGGGWTTLGTIKDNKMNVKKLTKDNLEYLVSNADKSSNVYIRACLFDVFTKKHYSNLLTLSHKDMMNIFAIVLDFDPVDHDKGFTAAERDYVAKALIEEYKCVALVSSGRGLQAWWFLNHNLWVNSDDYSKFKIIRENMLFEFRAKFKGIAKLDEVSAHGNGWARCPGTINQKNGEEATVIFMAQYSRSIKSLWKQFGNEGVLYRSLPKEEKKALKKAKKGKKSKEKKLPKLDTSVGTSEDNVLASYRDYANYVYHLRPDLEAIQEFYEKRGSTCREKILFNFSLVVRKLYSSYQKKLTLLEDLNDWFAEPLPQAEVEKIARQTKDYKVPTGYEIAEKLLGSDFEEWRKEYPTHMTVCSKEEWDLKQKEYAKAWSKQANAKKKAKRAATKAERDTLIREYYKQGMSKIAISKKLGIANKTVIKVLKGCE